MNDTMTVDELVKMIVQVETNYHDEVDGYESGSDCLAEVVSLVRKFRDGNEGGNGE